MTDFINLDFSVPPPFGPKLSCNYNIFGPTQVIQYGFWSMSKFKNISLFSRLVFFCLKKVKKCIILIFDQNWPPFWFLSSFIFAINLESFSDEVIHIQWEKSFHLIPHMTYFINLHFSGRPFWASRPRILGAAIV